MRHDFRRNDRVNWSTARKCVFSSVFTRVQLLLLIEARFRIRFSNRLPGIITEISCCNWKMRTRVCELDTAFNGRSTWVDVEMKRNPLFSGRFWWSIWTSNGGTCHYWHAWRRCKKWLDLVCNCQSEEKNSRNRDLVPIVHVGLIWTMQLATIDLPVMVWSLFVCVCPGVSVIWTHSITRDPKLLALTSLVYFSCW